MELDDSEASGLPAAGCWGSGIFLTNGEELNDLERPVGGRMEVERERECSLVGGRRAKMELRSELSSTLCVRGAIGEGFRADTLARARVASNLRAGFSVATD